MPKGQKFGGRQKGTRNKITSDVRTLCQQLIQDPVYQASFKQRLLEKTLPPVLEQMAWHYGYGKPIEHVELTGKDGGPLEVHDHLYTGEMPKR